MIARFRTVIDFLLHGNFFIALCAVAMVLQTNYLREFQVAGSALLIFIYAATFFLYNIHKYISLWLRPELLDTQRFAQFKRFDIPLSILTYMAAMLSFDTYMTLGMDIKKIVFYYACGASLYVIPFFKGKRIRDIYFIKNVWIAGIWACMVVALPAFALGRDWWATDTVLMLEKFFFVFALTIPFDIRDMSIDTQSGIKTIPLSMGVEKAKRVAYIALCWSFLMAFVLFYFQNYSLETVLKMGISLLFTAFFIKKMTTNQDDYFYYLGIDGLMILQTCIVLI
jgi:4-hydroxybenzoate polyprenyltransferase